MQKPKIISLILFVFLINNLLNAQQFLEYEYGFNKYYFNEEGCKIFEFGFNGNDSYHFTNNERPHLWRSKCKPDSLHVGLIYTPSFKYFPNEYFDEDVEQAHKRSIFSKFFKNCIAQADSINKYIRETRLNKLIINIQNPVFSDSVISHLCKGIITIDSLIIFNSLVPFNDYDTFKRIKYPMANSYYESVSYLNILSSTLVELPSYIFEPKSKPIETIVFVCDTLSNMEGLAKLTSLRKLVFIGTKNMDTFMPLILKLKSLEELYILNSDIRKVPLELLKLPALKTLFLIENNKLKKFPENIRAYEKLKYFTFKNYGNRKAREFSNQINKLYLLNSKKYNNY